LPLSHARGNRPYRSAPPALSNYFPGLECGLSAGEGGHAAVGLLIFFSLSAKSFAGPDFWAFAGLNSSGGGKWRILIFIYLFLILFLITRSSFSGLRE